MPVILLWCAVCVAAWGVGGHRYGKHYKSLADLSLTHLNAAADRREDHVHDGMGFLTQHVAMTMEFELALQSVQPHLAVPYWCAKKTRKERKEGEKVKKEEEKKREVQNGRR